MELKSILQMNEAAIEKWIHPPKFSSRFTFFDFLKLLHDTKRYFIIKKLKHLASRKEGALKVLDYGCGHGGITIDVKTYFKRAVDITGYDVSPKAIEIAKKSARRMGVNVNFLLDPECNLPQVVRVQYDAVISCDVFGHVPSVPLAFKEIHDILSPGGCLIAFSETVTGETLTVPRYLAAKGFRMDDSEEEHISLHGVRELKSFLESAGFRDVVIYPYDPVRFPFYPKRYLRKLRQCNFPLFLIALFLSAFQNRITEIFYNQINLLLSKRIALRDTAGCLLYARKEG